MPNELEAQTEATAPHGQALGQALLFSQEIEKRRNAEEEGGRYTLERFKLLREDAYQACIEELSRSKAGYEGLRRIAGIVGVHWRTVAAVRDDPDARETIDTLRSRLVRKLRLGAELLADRILESPDAIPANAIGMTLDQLIRNSELLDGRATSRVEEVQRVDPVQQWQEVLRAMRAEKQLGPEQARVIDSVGGENDAIAAGERCLVDRDIDAESAASASGSEESHRPLTTEHTAHGPAEARPDARNGGRGGSFERMGGPTRPISSEPAEFSDSTPPEATP